MRPPVLPPLVKGELRGILLIDEPKANPGICLDFNTLTQYKDEKKNHRVAFKPLITRTAINGIISIP